MSLSLLKKDTHIKSQERPLGTLPKGEFSTMIEPVKISEIMNLSTRWKNGKTPGPDGIPYAFYKIFMEMDAGIEGYTLMH